MSDIKKNIDIAVSSEKSFGITFAIIFLLLSLYFFFKNFTFFFFTISISSILLIISFSFPSILRIPNILWFKFGKLLGFVVSYIIMFILFYSIGVLTSLYLKISNKDPLSRKFLKNIDSYWLKKQKQTSLKDQF